MTTDSDNRDLRAPDGKDALDSFDPPGSEWLLQSWFIVSVAVVVFAIVAYAKECPSPIMTWLVLPCVMSILAIGVVLWSSQARRDKALRREREGRCTHCGYDLRASPKRCPECGRIPAAVFDARAGHSSAR